jgi:hypothetical protein
MNTSPRESPKAPYEDYYSHLGLFSFSEFVAKTVNFSSSFFLKNLLQ